MVLPHVPLAAHKWQTIKLLDDSTDLTDKLRRFDAAKARCFLDTDRQRLWATIESSFGTFAPFNAAVLRIFAEQLEKTGEKAAAGDQLETVAMARFPRTPLTQQQPDGSPLAC